MSLAGRLLHMICAICIAFVCTPLCAQSDNGFGGEVALDSQLVDRGFAITPDVPVLQSVVSYTTATAWSFGISASAELDSGHWAGATAQASRYWPLSNDWQMQTVLFYYDYSAKTGVQIPNRGELGVYWIYRDVLSFGLAADRFFGVRNDGLQGAVDLDFHWPLFSGISLSVGAGMARYPFSHYRAHSDAGSPATRMYDYGYGQAGLGWIRGPWRVELMRIATNGLPYVGHRLPRLMPWQASVSRSF